MWMEASAVFSGISMLMIAIVCSQIILLNMLLGFLCIVAMGLIIIGVIIIGMKTSDFKPMYDPTPRGWELMELQLLDGKVKFINTKKGAHGKRSFRIHNEDATVINDGKASFTLPNGNRGFRAHENFDMNVDPHRAKALSLMPGDNVKEIYYAARNAIDDAVDKKLEGDSVE